jgi:hypothetical protein
VPGDHRGAGGAAAHPSGGGLTVARDAATRLLSGLMVIIGVVMLVSTIARGGGPLASGVVLGLLFVAAGAARLYLSLRSGH